MPRAVRWVGLAISLAFVAMVLGSVFLPAEVRVERRIVVDRPVEIVYGLVDASAGRVVERIPNALVRTELDYGGLGTATDSVELRPSGSGTEVTRTYVRSFGWRPLRRWSGLALPREVGETFERELRTLKARAEATPSSR